MQELDFLQGKSIECAGFVTDEDGNTEFVMRLADGSTVTVSAWQPEGYPIDMSVEESAA